MTARPTARRATLIAVLTLFTAAACGDGSGGSPAADAPVVVTFEVVEERFKALLTDPADIAIARSLLAGQDVPNIPNGRVVRETGVNEGYSWSLDPNDFEWASVTIEVCDGLPSDVETGVLTSDRYCPWSAVVIGVEPAG